jgi:hypothetical protein
VLIRSVRKVWHLHCSNADTEGGSVRVRIIEKPREHDIEGVSLDTMRPGTICDVSATIGSWLIVQGYAYPEMRRTPEDDGIPVRQPMTGPSERRHK